MAVFSVTALDRLIDSDRKSSSSAGSGPVTSKSLQPGLQKQSSSGNGGGGGRGIHQRQPLLSYVSYPSSYSSTTTPAAAATPHPQTPPLRPRSPSPTSFSPSPYVVNHKRRVPNGVDSKRTSQQNGFHVSQNSSTTRPSKSQELAAPKAGKDEQREQQQKEVEAKADFRNLQDRSSDEGWSSSSTDVANNNDGQRAVLREDQHGKSPQSNLTLQFQAEKAHDGSNADGRSLPMDEKLDAMFRQGRVAAVEKIGKETRVGGEEGSGMMSSNNVDPRGKGKVEEKSENGGSSNTTSREGNLKRIVQILDESRNGSRTTSSSSSEEWFDAPDGLPPDYLSDDDSRSVALTDPGPSSRGDPDSNVFYQLRAEIQKRIAAEEAREEFRRQRDGMAQMLSSAGMSVPQSGLGNVEIEIAQPRDNNVVGVSDNEFQRLTVARYVAGAVATGVVRAEAEAELQTVLAEKSREIARLKDKLQYYEVVNHEMSQRNQESIENARQTRRRRQRRHRLVFLGISAAIFVGVSVAVAYKYVPWDYLKDLRSEASSELPEGEQPDYSSSLEQVVDSIESTEPEN